MKHLTTPYTALNILLNQVYQMERMFPDDRELKAAVQEAERTLENEKEATALLNGLMKLWDMVSDMIEGGCLTETDIPNDYHALVAHMIILNGLMDHA